MDSMNKKPAQLTILGGFLGSGKTTLLNTILKTVAENSRTAVIINDFGDVNIDGLLIERGSYSKKEISGGCICCSLKEKLLESLLGILEEEDPREIYIEATGLAVPWDMKQSIEKNFSSSRIIVRQVLICVDVSQFNRFHGPLPVYKRQFEGSPHILMTKSDLYEKEIPPVEAVIRSSYPLISSLIPVANGQLDLSHLSEPVNKVPAGNTPFLMPGLLSGAFLHKEKGNIIQLSYKGIFNFSSYELEKIISRVKEKILRLKGILILKEIKLIVHFDGTNFSAEEYTANEANSIVYSQKNSQMTLFCLEKFRVELNSLFHPLFE